MCVFVLFLLPWLAKWLTARYGNRTAAVRTKMVPFVLCGLGALALWAGSEAVLPAYLAGRVLAGNAARDHQWARRLRTLNVGLLTPFYFIRSGSPVSLPAPAVAPLTFLALLLGKVASKIGGLYPVIGAFRRDRRERWYYTLLMSTGLTFGTLSALYGLSHGILTQTQYSFVVAAIIASAVIPTAVGNYVFLPGHLLPKTPRADERRPAPEEAGTRRGALSHDSAGPWKEGNRGLRTAVRTVRFREEAVNRRKILAGLDGSGGAFKALEETVRLARACGAELHSVSVEEIPRCPQIVDEVVEAKEEADEKFRTVLRRADEIAERERGHASSHRARRS